MFIFWKTFNFWKTTKLFNFWKTETFNFWKTKTKISFFPFDFSAQKMLSSSLSLLLYQKEKS